MTVTVAAEADGDAESVPASQPEVSPEVPPQPTPEVVPNITLPVQQQQQQIQPQMSPPPTPPPLTDEELLAAFPIAKLNKLDEMISNPRQVVNRFYRYTSSVKSSSDI